MEQNKKLKLLWSSNASFTPTGYGQVTNQVAYGLFENGIDIRVACNYGLAGASLGLNGLIHYPNLFAEIGEDALKIIIDSWKPDVFVTLYDVWVGAKAKHAGIECLFKSLHDRWIAYVPVDHLPIPDAVADQSRRAYKVVAMSQFGQEQFKSVGIPSTYIPHGADTKIYKPSDKAVAKEWLQKHSTPYSEKKPAVYDKDSFIVGINAANKDPMRKDFGRMFTAFQIFLDQNPDAKKDARMHVHTWAQFPGGFNLIHLAQKLGIDSYIRAPFQYDMLCSLPIERMADVYNSMDVFMNLTRGEGFGVPIIEAQACGVPAIVTDFTSMTELVKGHGWLVPSFAERITCPECKSELSYNGGAKMFSHMMSLYSLPDEYKCADAIEDAYNHPEKIKKFGEQSREFALDYDYKTKIIPQWLDLLGEVKSELGMLGKWSGKDEGYDDMFKEAMQ